MLHYDHLIGIPFEHGVNDCYELGRRFFKDNFNIEMTRYARPDEWWRHSMNLYMENFMREGFELVENSHPTNLQPSDVFLCAIMSPVANHAAILLEDGEILHHLFGRLSTKEPLRGLVKNTTVAVLRHKMVKYEPTLYTENLIDKLPEQIRARLQTDVLPQRRDGEGESGVRSEEQADRS